MYQGDKAFFGRLKRVLREQDAVLRRLQSHELEPKERRAIGHFLRDLHGLQNAMWNSLAGRPRARLLAAARQVDVLAEHWSELESHLGLSDGAAAQPPAASPRSELDSAA